MRTILPAGGCGLLAMISFLLLSCDPLPELRRADLGDVRPPVLLNQTIGDDGQISLSFDEPVSLIPDSLHLTIGPSAGSNRNLRQAGALRLLSAGGGTDPTAVRMAVVGDTQPGREYAVEAAVRDAAGNSLTLVMPFYGPNPHPAILLLNEALVKISTKNRDALEFFVKQGGNLGGITVFLGVPMDFDASYTFPAIQVPTGEYLVLHCKPEGTAGETDEIADTSAASGANCLPTARDFWWREGPGLPDDTGIVSLANNPLGAIKDALFYTSKVTVPGKDWRSFGTKKLMDRADALQTAGAWKCARENIAPEDGCRSSGLTSTRSLGRDALSSDSDSAADWHIVPTKGASPGGINSDQRYETPSAPEGDPHPNE